MFFFGDKFIVEWVDLVILLKKKSGGYLYIIEYWMYYISYVL